MDIELRIRKLKCSRAGNTVSTSNGDISERKVLNEPKLGQLVFSEGLFEHLPMTSYFTSTGLGHEGGKRRTTNTLTVLKMLTAFVQEKQ